MCNVYDGYDGLTVGVMMMTMRIYICDCQAGTAALQLRQVGDQVGTARLTIMISTIITIIPVIIIIIATKWGRSG